MKVTRGRLILIGVSLLGNNLPAKGLISSDHYPSLQAAIDANPGEMILVPNGDHPLSATVRIQKDGTGLYGPGRLVQHNAKAEILRVDDAKGVRIKDLTLTRAEGAKDATEPGFFGKNCVGLELDGVRVIDNKSPAGSIRFFENTNSTVRNCTVQNYKTVTIDDRMASPLSGYAFRCIDGTGIVIYASTGTQVLNNRVLEYDLLPTKEIRDRYDLGAVTTMSEVRGSLAPADIFTSKYTNNWHQGSGIVALNLGRMQNTIISGNYIENVAQGMDIHSDYVVVSNNIVTNAMMGMKAMHGSKHVIITGNQFTKTDLYGLMLQPGAASDVAQPTSGTEQAKEANIDGGTIVANNIFSDFGYGDQYWNWERPANDLVKRGVIAIRAGQLPTSPPQRDIIITGNVVYDPGEDELIVDGKPTKVPPRYAYALFVDQDAQNKPVNVRLTNNILNPGTKGVANFELPNN